LMLILGWQRYRNWAKNGKLWYLVFN